MEFQFAGKDAGIGGFQQIHVITRNYFYFAPTCREYAPVQPGIQETNDTAIFPRFFTDYHDGFSGITRRVIPIHVAPSSFVNLVH